MGEPPPVTDAGQLARFRGIIFTTISLLSALLGCIYILGPLVPLMLINHSLWRRVVDRLIGIWLVLPCGLVEFLFGTKVITSGARIERGEPAVIIMNHRTCLDWLFFWSALIQMDLMLLTSQKISLKGMLRHIPGPGWAMATNAFIFLTRRYEKDNAHIENMIDYYAASGNAYQLLLFPEGTDKDYRASERSRQYAMKRGLEDFRYVLHPRTTGFKLILQKMRQINYVANIYDVTVAYPESIVQSELDLVLYGFCPKSVHYTIRKIDVNSLPENDDALANWLVDLWRQKEAKLAKFYEPINTEDRHFDIDSDGNTFQLSNSGRILYVAIFITWLVVTCVWLYIFLAYPSQHLVAFFSIFTFYGFQLLYGGLEKFALRASKDLQNVSERNNNDKFTGQRERRISQ